MSKSCSADPRIQIPSLTHEIARSALDVLRLFVARDYIVHTQFNFVASPEDPTFSLVDQYNHEFTGYHASLIRRFTVAARERTSTEWDFRLPFSTANIETISALNFGLLLLDQQISNLWSYRGLIRSWEDICIERAHLRPYWRRRLFTEQQHGRNQQMLIISHEFDCRTGIFRCRLQGYCGPISRLETFWEGNYAFNSSSLKNLKVSV